jgi:asparagine synthase (glutamine-hydrolysing)
MPGIFGLITRMRRQQAEQELLRLLAAAHHNASDTAGTHIDESLGVYLGWIARKGSFADGMPLRSKQSDTSLVISGEEFPEPGAVRLRNSASGASNGEDASYLLQSYEDDPSFPRGLNGRFHGLLVDRKRQLTLLFNDRYAMHRIYYHKARDAFYFAAEAKAILAVRPELRVLDPQGLGEFVVCGCTLENRTLFRSVQILPAASAWEFRAAQLERQRVYFEPREWENQEPLEPEPYFCELRAKFEQNLPRYFNGRERVGMSLTGGLDTRMIMAWQRPLPGSLPCYSFGGMYRECQDVVMARKVAHACGQTHEVIPVASEFLSRFPGYAERSVHLTDGCVGVGHTADLYLNERAAQIAPVRMTGNYGGEVLRRVVAFQPEAPRPGLFAGEILPHVDAARRTYANLIQCHPLSFAVFRQAPWHHYGLLALEQTQVSVRSPYLDNDFVRTVYRAPQTACTNDDVSWRLIAEGDPRLARIRTDRGVSGAGNPGANIIHGIMNFTFKAEYAYDYGMPQWMARIDHVFSRLHLERLFLGRHKFRHYRVWYRDALSNYVREMLLDSRTLSRPYLERRTVEAIVRGHLREGRNYTTEIHKLLTLELISRTLIESR